MFINSLDVKELFTKPDGVQVRDLTQSMFNLHNRNYTTFEVFKVPKDYVMRPDLIAKSVYNNSIYAEVILKFNGISNPFSIDEGDVILVPDLDSAKAKIRESGEGFGTSQANKIRDTYKYLDPLKIPKRGEDLKKFDERQIVNAPEESLPPNLAEEGTSQVTHRGGRVYFGEGAEVCLKNGMSSGEYLSKIIDSRG